MKKINRAKTGHQCKEEGKSVANFKKTTWEKKASDLCKPGICQKFIENTIPRNILINKTSGKRIVECTKETPWGCGLALKDENCLVPTKWTSQGIMGSMLEDIRQELSCSDPNKNSTSSASCNNSQDRAVPMDLNTPSSLEITPGSSQTLSGTGTSNNPTYIRCRPLDSQESTSSSESSNSDSEMQQ